MTQTRARLPVDTLDSEKLTPSPLSSKCPHWFNPLSMRTHRKFQKNSNFLRQKVRTSASEESPLSSKCPHCTNPSPSDCERHLWTAPYIKLLNNPTIWPLQLNQHRKKASLNWCFDLFLERYRRSKSSMEYSPGGPLSVSILQRFKTNN